MGYSNLKRQFFVDDLRRYADTVLYETALEIIEKVEKNKMHPQDDVHWKNAAIYSEFWRREKYQYYNQAFQTIQLKMGYKSVPKGD